MTGYVQTPTRVMPTQVKVLRIILYVVAGATFMYFAAGIVIYPNAQELGENAGMPLILGIAGAALALVMRPGRFPVRIGIIVVEALWLLIALGRIGNGDPTAVFAMVLPITLLVLVNIKPARRFFSRDNAKG